MPALKRTKVLSATVLLLSMGATAYGQVPPSNDTSDANRNTGMGTGALQNNSGEANTGSGYQALSSNTTGISNTGTGHQVLFSNSTGSGNTASGDSALYYNTTGSNNTASGVAALGGTAASNANGDNNAAFGAYALGNNTTGFSNTATGAGALRFNSIGSENAAFGEAALWNNTSGNDNIAIGLQALFSNTTGNGNIALGLNAGTNLTTGDNNIDISNQGVGAESGTIRIGDPKAQHAAYIAGIWGHIVKPGSPVFVGPDGKLGVVASSERYKTDITPMGSSTSKISQLRPVTFHLKADATGELQYGLIAEEVDRVFPELVVRDEAGKIEGVRYDELAPMLVNELQQQQQQAAAQDTRLATQELKLAAQAEQLAGLKQQFAELQELNHEMQVALMKLQAEESQVAMR
jgi:hypothetical protein